MRQPRRVWCVLTLLAVVMVVAHGGPAWAQVPRAEMDAIKQEIRRLQERLEKLERLEQAQRAPAPAALQAPVPAALAPASAQAVPPPAGEREITLESEHIFERFGLPKPELGGLRISGFFVGSANYNSRIQMVPEFAGNAPVTSEAKSVDFKFDQFTIGVSKTFASWLSAGASLEVERHSTRHAHGFDPAFGCPGTGLCIERFGSEPIETEIDLHRFHITGIAPIGNGLALSFGRFDAPFGYERHDAPLNLTATLSEVQRFGRPMSMTGFTVSYPFAPWLDATAWIVNRWENETTEDPFEDNNRDKSFGGRIGFTPLPGRHLLNFGIGGWWGPERSDNTSDPRWIVDFDVTWSPLPRLLLAGELVYGGESGVSFRKRGIPYAAPAVSDKDVNWLGLYALLHYDITDWLGLSFRYGFFDDQDGARTGVKQVLQSWTFTPIVHLSRLIPDLRPLGVTYARTRHPLDWVDLRLEYRLNHSNKPVFSDARPGVNILDADHTSHQLTLQFVVSAEERQAIHKRSGWTPEEDFYRFYVGRDEQGRLIAATTFLTEFTIHGPVRVAVALGPEGKVKGATITELTEETYPWVKPLLDRNFTRDYVGQDGRGRFAVSELGRAGGGDMAQFYGQVIASLIQRAAILYEATIAK